MRVLGLLLLCVFARPAFASSFATQVVSYTAGSNIPGGYDDPLSSLGPRQAPQIPFVWHNGGPTYLYGVDPVGTLGTLLTGPQGAGAGKIGLTTDEWLSVAN